MKFEIINPSDEAYIEGDFKNCCLATLFFGEGKYALSQVDGDLKMPLFLLGYGVDDWLVQQFGNTLDALLSETPTKDIAEALLSVHLARERSSLNDFTSYAHKLAKAIMEKEEEET